MATSKDQPKKTDAGATRETPKDQPASKTSAARKADEKPFAEQGLTLAGDARAFAEDLRGQLTDWQDRVTGVFTDSVPQDGDEQVAAGCRRLTTALSALNEQVDALVGAAAQLERDSVR